MTDPPSESAGNHSTNLSPIELIPEDVVLHLVAIIKSWVLIERPGSLKEKEERRK